MTALIVIASIVGYLVMGGITGVGIQRTLDEEDFWDHPGPILGGLFWPMVIPFYLGVWVARAPDRRADHEKEVRQMMADRTRQLEKELGIREGRY